MILGHNENNINDFNINMEVDVVQPGHNVTNNENINILEINDTITTESNKNHHELSQKKKEKRKKNFIFNSSRCFVFFFCFLVVLIFILLVGIQRKIKRNG